MAPVHFGQYLLERKLGSGGMAEVWLARSTAGGPVVIKRVVPHLAANPRFTSMLRTEARVVQRIDHPHIVKVFEADSVDGVAYIAMEYIDGWDLATLHRLSRQTRSRPPVPVALRIAHSVAEALTAAHGAFDQAGVSLGLIHRDVSPNNLMIGSNGVVKLLDFGIVKVADEAHTEPGMIKGKYDFMSPEQAAGAPLDQRSDLFSLGLVLYQLLSGINAHRRDNEPAAYRAALEGVVAPLSSVWAEAPAQLEAMLIKALAREPGERFVTAAELSAALERCGPLADHAAVARWASSLSAGPAPMLPEADTEAYLSSRSLDESGRMVAPGRVVTAADFNAPEDESLELSRDVKARSSVALPNSTGRPSMVLLPVKRLDLPAEPPPGVKPPLKPPEVLPSLAAKPVVPSAGLPVKLVLAAAAAVVLITVTLLVVFRGQPTVAAPVAIAVEPQATIDAGVARDDDLDPVTGMRRSLGAVVIASPDHLARDHSDLEPVRYFIDSVPEGAAVTVNGEPVGDTPWGGDSDPLRGGRITVSKKGYAPWSGSVDAGIDFAVTVKLKRR